MIKFAEFTDISSGKVWRTDDKSQHRRIDPDVFGVYLISVSIGSPSVRRYTVEVPGMDGVLDYSDIFGTAYDNRTIELEVGQVIRDRYRQDSEIKNALHGRNMKIALSEDPEYYYTGMVSVGEWVRNAGVASCVITCDCAPWKLKRYETLEGGNITSEYKKFFCFNQKRPVIPIFTVTEQTSIKWGDSEYVVNAGSHKLLNIQFEEGYNTVEAKTVGVENGKITVRYQEASL